MKNLENKLNKEYKDFGKIEIREMHEDVIPTSQIDYINPVLEKIEPLDSDEPIVLGKKYYHSERYDLIDGYHRLKNKIQKGEPIKAFILDNYRLYRNHDTLYEFLSSLVGKEITFISDDLLLVDGIYYKIESNEGCGGCSNGWSNIEVVPEFINQVVKVKTIKNVGEQDSDLYDLYINDIKVAEVDTGYGNGYYGGDFTIHRIA